MACPAQSMLSASTTSCCVFLRSSAAAKPQAAAAASLARGGRLFLLSCNASSSSSPSPSSPPPPPAEAEEDCNEEECAPEKEVGSLSAEWLAEERTKVVGTFPPKKKGWTGYVEKDTAGQTNIYSVEPTVYVAESAISSGAAGAAADGSENTAAIAGGLALVFVAGVSSILIQVGKNQPPPQATVYSGPPLSYYVAKFQPSLAAVALQQQQPPAVDAPATEDASSPAPASPAAAAAEDQLSS
uniref:Proline-rich family protein n=1 Tax=Oryza meridionalis TaxID=40149 RepID=A0A0E0CLZ2_9ORYZ